MKVDLKGVGVFCSLGSIVGIFAGNLFTNIVFTYYIFFLLVIVILIVLTGFIFVFLKEYQFSPGSKKFFVYFTLIILFFSISYINTSRILSFTGDFEDIVGEKNIFYGEISGASTRGENFIHYPLRLISLSDVKLNKEVIVRLSKRTSVIEEDGGFYPGDVLKVKGTLEYAPPATNPGEFNYQAYLEGRGKSFLIYPDESQKIDKKFNVFRGGALVVDYIKTILEKNLSEEAFGWVAAVAFGDKAGLSEDDKVNLHNAGAGHIVAVSGMHLSIIGMGIFWFFIKRGIDKKYSILIALAVIWFYTSMVGLKPSVLRAAIMLTFFILTEFYGRQRLRLSSFDSLFIALNCLLLIFPRYLFNVGFQLSFSATFFILLLYPFFNEKLRIENMIKLHCIDLSRLKIIIEPVKVSLAALIGVFPLLLYHFGEASLGSLIISPFVALVLPLLIILAFAGSAFIFLKPLASLIFIFLDIICLYLSNLLEVIAAVSPRIKENWPVLQVLSFYGMVISFLYLLKSSLALVKLRYAYIGFFVFVILFVAISLKPYLDRGLKVVFLDIGHGDCIYINTPGGSDVLIDGGGVYDGSPVRDPGESILVPFLENKGVDEIDLMVATHPHVDHIGGLREVLRNFETGIVVLPQLHNPIPEYEEFINLIIEKEVNTLVVNERKRFQPESKLVFDIIHPETPYLVGTGSDLNNNSVVVRLIYDNVSFLFTGDLEEEGERHLLSSGVDLKSNILKVGHHGSSTSSTREFLREVSPGVAVISAGRNSPYGFPALETLERLKEEGIFVIRTDEWGAVKVISNGKYFEFETFLKERLQ